MAQVVWTPSLGDVNMVQRQAVDVWKHIRHHLYCGRKYKLHAKSGGDGNFGR